MQCEISINYDLFLSKLLKYLLIAVSLRLWYQRWLFRQACRGIIVTLAMVCSEEHVHCQLVTLGCWHQALQCHFTFIIKFCCWHWLVRTISILSTFIIYSNIFWCDFAETAAIQHKQFLQTYHYNRQDMYEGSKCFTKDCVLQMDKEPTERGRKGIHDNLTIIGLEWVLFEPLTANGY